MSLHMSRSTSLGRHMKMDWLSFMRYLRSGEELDKDRVEPHFIPVLRCQYSLFEVRRNS